MLRSAKTDQTMAISQLIWLFAGNLSVFIYILEHRLIVCRLNDPKQPHWQTAITQMKCHTMWHFIRVCTVNSDGRKTTIFLSNETYPFLNTRTILTFVVCSFMENSIGLKRGNCKWATSWKKLLQYYEPQFNFWTKKAWVFSYRLCNFEDADQTI